MKDAKLITIDEQGQVLTLYADDLPDLGKKKIFRASEVEPHGDQWTVRLSDHEANGGFAGMYLGPRSTTVPNNEMAKCFDTRAEALAAEIDFIQQHIMEGKQHA